MRRPIPQWRWKRHTIGPVEGKGPTQADAKADAMAAIERAFAPGGYCPIILAVNGCAVLIWRELDGWSFKIIQEFGTLETGALWGGVSSYSDKEECLRSARAHLAQCAWTPETTETCAAWLPEGEREEFLRWVEFQQRAAQARRRGMNDVDAHAYACRDPFRPEIWKDDICGAAPA